MYGDWWMDSVTYAEVFDGLTDDGGGEVSMAQRWQKIQAERRSWACIDIL